MRKVRQLRLLVLLCLAGFPALPADGPGVTIELQERIPREADQAKITIRKAAALDLDFAGNLYIIDRGRHQLLKFSPAGELIDQVGGFGQAAEQFDDPRDVDAHTTLDVFVADYNNNRVVRFDKNLNFLNALNSQWPDPYRFEQVISLAVSSQYDLFLLEESAGRVIKFSRFSEPTAAFGGIYETFGQLLEPVQMCIDGSQRLFVSDPAQGAVIVFDYLGNYVSSLTHPDLAAPAGMCWGEDQQLYVVNRGTADIFVFSKTLAFRGLISLKAYADEIIDVALKQEQNQPSKRLYALTRNHCLVFRVNETAK